MFETMSPFFHKIVETQINFLLIIPMQFNASLLLHECPTLIQETFRTLQYDYTLIRYPMILANFLSLASVGFCTLVQR